MTTPNPWQKHLLRRVKDNPTATAELRKYMGLTEQDWMPDDENQIPDIITYIEDAPDTMTLRQLLKLRGFQTKPRSSRLCNALVKPIHGRKYTKRKCTQYATANGYCGRHQSHATTPSTS